MVKTVRVYSIPVATMNDYVRSGSNRYGNPEDLTRNVQELIVNKDRGFTFVIDKGDKIQSLDVSDAGAALARQIREVIVPEFDTYCFARLAEAAQAAGGYATTAVTKSNAYEMFLAGQEYLGDHNVPMNGRVAFCSYHFANLMMQDPAFIKYSDKSQEMVIKGAIGEIDGVTIVKVASGKLPAGAAFILTHKEAAVGPEQLNEYRIHDNPPGYSGWLVEGRVIYDCFVLNEKRDGVYYHGGQSLFKVLDAHSAATDTGKTTIYINGELGATGNKWYYQTKAANGSFDTLTYGSAITAANWTEMKDASNNPINHVEITPTATHVKARVIETDASGYPLAFDDIVLNIG